MSLSRVSLSVVPCSCAHGSLESVAGQHIQDEAGSRFGISIRNVHFVTRMPPCLICESNRNNSLECSPENSVRRLPGIGWEIMGKYCWAVIFFFLLGNYSVSEVVPLALIQKQQTDA